MNKMRFKMILDIMMTALFLLLMSTQVTGTLLHELLGIFLAAVFAVHIGLNFKWVKGVFPRVFGPSLKKSVKIMALVDALLVPVMGTAAVTGILISQELFGFGQSLENPDFLSALHSSTAYLSLILLSVHIGMHWEMIMRFFTKLPGMIAAGRARTAPSIQAGTPDRARRGAVRPLLARAIVLCIVAAGIRACFVQDLAGSLTAPFTVSGNGSEKSESILTISKEEDGTEIVFLSATTISASDTTLEDYLSKLYCTGCHRHCPLSNPQCSKGVRQAASAEEEYNAQYAENSTAQSDETAQSDSTAQSNSTAQSDDTTQSDDATQSDDTSQSDDTVHSISQAVSGLSELAPLADTFSMMGLFIAGTHYVYDFSKKKKK